MEDTSLLLQNATNDSVKSHSYKGVVTIGKVVDIYDGDTLKIVIVVDNKLVKLTCRMSGFDSPELSNKNDNNAYVATNVLMKETTDVPVTDIYYIYKKKERIEILNQNKKIISVHFHGCDKWKRELVTLHDNAGCINDRLLRYSFNIKYDGKTSRPQH